MNECPRFNCTNYCQATRPHAYTVSPAGYKSGYFPTFLQALNPNHKLSFNKYDGWNLWFYCFPNYPESYVACICIFFSLVGCLFISWAKFSFLVVLILCGLDCNYLLPTYHLSFDLLCGWFSQNSYLQMQLTPTSLSRKDIC